jgi:hypothetical protein
LSGTAHAQFAEGLHFSANFETDNNTKREISDLSEEEQKEISDFYHLNQQFSLCYCDGYIPFALDPDLPPVEFFLTSTTLIFI